jgi:2-polyprenyl-3-methyl-5-hydroxy-6-metoxy-1,4-benzoquinol methylase
MEIIMANQWDLLAADWEDQPENIELADKAYASLTDTVVLSGKHVLDFGCGSGRLSQRLSPKVKSIIALDASEAMIEELDTKELYNVEPVVDSLTRGLVAQHPAFRKQFDLVVACAVCSYLDNVAEALAIIYSLLDKGGMFVHWDWIAEDEEGSVGLGIIEMQDKLILAGFSDVIVTQAFKINAPHGPQNIVMGVAIK